VGVLADHDVVLDDRSRVHQDVRTDAHARVNDRAGPDPGPMPEVGGSRHPALRMDQWAARPSHRTEHAQHGPSLLHISDADDPGQSAYRCEIEQRPEPLGANRVLARPRRRVVVEYACDRPAEPDDRLGDDHRVASGPDQHDPVDVLAVSLLAHRAIFADRTRRRSVPSPVPRGIPLFMRTLRVGSVRYLNTAPLVHGLEALDSIQISPAAPSRIIDLLLNHDIDIGLVSLIDAAHAKEPVAMLPVGMIGCSGRTMTVRLYSKVPFDRVERLHADTDSHTSIALAQVLLDRLHSVRPEIIAYDARELVEINDPRAPARCPDTLLLIGDKVVTHAPDSGEYPHQLDLGQAWHALTSLPFVYAVWMCRLGDAGTPEINTAAAILDRQRRHNATRLHRIAADHAPIHRWPLDLAKEYLTELLRYEVGEMERRAIARFFRDSAELGLIPETTPVWHEPSPVVKSSNGAAQ